MTKAITSALIAIAGLGFASSGWGGALKVEPGLWMTTVIQHGGPPRRNSHCVTQEEIDGFANLMAQPSRHSGEENCLRTSFHETATAVDWKYACTGKFTVTQEGSIKFDRASHYTGTIKTTGSMNGKAINDSSSMEGLRLGACPKGGAAP